MKTALLAAATLSAQAALGLPSSPSWMAAVLLPVVFITAPPLLRSERRWPHFALLLGLAWDLMLEPVVGPGAIAWSAAAVAIGLVVPLVADRSPRAWLVFGALGAALVIVVREAALLPLGLAGGLSWRSTAVSVSLTALWCCLVGWIIALDLPSRWLRFRSRKLR
ncbi:MAG: hypothetical protein V2I67_04650 [Thermoanaerobaculales bacterium]|jgi:hypothetical protein|nr:hypothetical protein [Thermoanaerobaculales bacterium]